MNEKINILVVDDREEGLLAVRAVLDSPDYNLVTAFSGQEALRHLLSMDFAVILLDVQMPIINGFETAAIIKTREKSRDIPIIFMSAINQDEMYVYQGYEAGAVDYLLKPFDPYILKSKVAVFVDIYRKKQLIKQQSQKLIENELSLHSMAMANLEIESLKRYRYLADSIPQIVFRVDANGAGLYFNKIWYEYTGLEENIIQDWMMILHPGEHQQVLKLFEKKNNNLPQEIECRLLDRHGCFRWHLIRIHPESYGNMSIMTWLGTATDIQERKQNEETNKFLATIGETLITTLDQKTLLANFVRDAIPYMGDWCTFDNVLPNGQIENVLCYHRDEKNNERTKKLDRLIKDHPNSLHPQKKVLESKKENVFEKIGFLIKKNSDLDEEQNNLAEELSETSSLVLPLYAHGDLVGILTFYSFESGRKYDSHYVELGKEIGRRLAMSFLNAKHYLISQQAIETRNQFLSIASHELNTPITSLKLHLQLIGKSLQSTKEETAVLGKFRKSIDASIGQVNRLITLVQVLLDVSHIQSGKFVFNYGPVNVSEMASEIVERHSEILANYDCTLSADIAPGLQAVWDKTRIEQVFINLITNAIKYAPGKIELKVFDDGPNVRISVKDFGKGIPANKLDTIFDRFERVSNNNSIGGLGLGLFIVKQIIEGHRGTIGIVSEVGKGSCFSVTLPKKAQLEMQT